MFYSFKIYISDTNSAQFLLKSDQFFFFLENKYIVHISYIRGSRQNKISNSKIEQQGANCDDKHTLFPQKQIYLGIKTERTVSIIESRIILSEEHIPQSSFPIAMDCPTGGAYLDLLSSTPSSYGDAKNRLHKLKNLDLDRGRLNSHINASRELPDLRRAPRSRSRSISGN